MRLIDAYQKLELLNGAALQTRDAAGVLGINISHASKILERLAKIGLVVFLKKGLWAFPKRMNELLLPRYCSAPFPSYVSLQTGLYHHDMIMQVPAVIYSITLGRTKLIKTPLGNVSLHHIDPSFFFGFEIDLKSGIALASPEKSLLDFLYLASAKSNLFGILPELELPKNFSLKKATEMIKRIPSIQRRTLVKRLFDNVMIAHHIDLQ